MNEPGRTRSFVRSRHATLATSMAKQESGSKRRRPVVMIVDDDRDFQDCFGMLLEDDGFEVVRAWDGYPFGRPACLA
jgi:hypothetical protein